MILERYYEEFLMRIEITDQYIRSILMHANRSESKHISLRYVFNLTCLIKNIF